MKTVKIEGKTVKISDPQIRSLERLKRRGFVAARSEFWEGRPRHLSFALDIKNLYGVGQVIKCALSGDLLAMDINVNKQAVRRFFKQNPRCKSAIVGNPRRINSILRQIDAEG
jgi:hypothetical protein